MKAAYVRPVFASVSITTLRPVIAETVMKPENNAAPTPHDCAVAHA